MIMACKATLLNRVLFGGWAIAAGTSWEATRLVVLKAKDVFPLSPMPWCGRLHQLSLKYNSFSPKYLCLIEYPSLLVTTTGENDVLSRGLVGGSTELAKFVFPRYESITGGRERFEFLHRG